jgi:hypothetical protein
MHSSPVLPTRTSVPIRTNHCLRTLVPSMTLTGDSQYSKYPRDVGNINILDCNPMSDRPFSHPTDSRLSEQVLHASTDEFPIFLAPSDSQFCTTDFLLFSDAPMTRPTTFRLTATLSLSSSDSRSLSIRRPTFLVVASRSQCLSARSLSMSIVYKSTGA